jgi:hypothetical protein
VAPAVAAAAVAAVGSSSAQLTIPITMMNHRGAHAVVHAVAVSTYRLQRKSSSSSLSRVVSCGLHTMISCKAVHSVRVCSSTCTSCSSAIVVCICSSSSIQLCFFSGSVTAAVARNVLVHAAAAVASCTKSSSSGQIVTACSPMPLTQLQCCITCLRTLELIHSANYCAVLFIFCC